MHQSEHPNENCSSDYPIEEVLKIAIRDVLKDVSTLLQKVEAQELERYVKEIDKKYNGFLKRYEDSGFILTQERKQILDSIKDKAEKGNLNLFVILAAFGFGKSLLLTELNSRLSSGKIKFAGRNIKSIQLRLNVHDTLPRIVKEILRTLLGTDESLVQNIIELIYEDSKKLPLIQPLPKEEAKERIRSSLFKGALDLDMLINSLTSTELLELIDRTIGAFEARTSNKVIFIVDEIEHTGEKSAFPSETTQFLALLTRNFYEREKENFVGIIAAAPEPGIEIPILRFLGATRRDIIDRVLQEGIGTEIKLDIATALELMQRVLRFYLHSLIDISGSDPLLKERLDNASTHEQEEYTHPVSRSLLEYLAHRGLTKTEEGFIYDFRSYLILVGDILNAWIGMATEENLVEEANDKTMHGLTVTKFWQPSLNKEARNKPLTKNKIALKGIKSAIFLEDVEKFIEDVCEEVEEKDSEIIDTIKWIVKESLESNDEKFRMADEQIANTRAIPKPKSNEFRQKLNETITSISKKGHEFVEYSWGSIVVFADKLEEEIAGKIEAVGGKPSIFYNILKQTIGDKPVKDIEFYDILEKCIKEEKLGKQQVNWAIEKEGEREYLFYDLRSETWGSRIFVAKNMDQEEFIRRKVKENNRYDKGIIINLNEDKLVVILPEGLEGLENEMLDDIRTKRGPKIQQKKEFKEIYDQINEIAPDMPEHRKYYLITLILPYYFRYKDALKDEPSQLSYCYLWNEITTALKKQLERDWIVSRTGLEIVKDGDFKSFASTFLKAIIVCGTKTNLREHDPAVLRENAKIESYRPLMKEFGLGKIWDLPILSKSEFEEIATRQEYAEIFQDLKIKDETLLIPRIREFLSWIRTNVKKKGKISIGDASDYLFGIKIERNLKLSWNITVEGKLSVLFLFLLGHYYGYYGIRVKDGQIWAIEITADIETFLNACKEALMERIEQAIVGDALKQKVDVTEVFHLWRMYTAATQYKNAEKKLNAAQSLQDKIEKLSPVEIHFDFSKVLAEIKSLLKTPVIEKDFSEVGDYLRELHASIEEPTLDRMLIAKRTQALIDNLQMQVRGVEETERLNSIIKSLGNYTKQPKELEKTDFLKELQRLEKVLEDEYDQNDWHQAISEGLRERIETDCLQSLQKERVTHTSVDSYLKTRMPSERISDYSEDETKQIETKIAALKERFEQLRQEKEKALREAEKDIKKYAIGDFKERANALVTRIENDLAISNKLDPEKTSTESVFTEMDNAIHECNMLKKTFAVTVGAVFDAETKILLEKLVEVDYNINNLCKSEFGSSLWDLILKSTQGNEMGKKALEKIAKLLMTGEKINVTFEV